MADTEAQEQEDRYNGVDTGDAEIGGQHDDRSSSLSEPEDDEDDA